MIEFEKIRGIFLTQTNDHLREEHTAQHYGHEERDDPQIATARSDNVDASMTAALSA